MRYAGIGMAGLFVLAALGCSSATNTPTTSTPSESTLSPLPQAAAQGDLGAIYSRNGLIEGAAAIYAVHVDPATLSATSELKALRAAQANDDLYLLPIDGFFNATSLKITSVSASVDTVDLGYTISHPFPAPNNPTGTANGSTNRSDLGVAGMVLVLADAPATGNTYFTDRVANTELVANADAYFSPGGMISTTGLTANTFPFKQLVDEIYTPTGSRLGVDNQGTPTGNYGTDGWTRAEYGTGNDDWTGYGVLHGGQTSANTLSLNKAALGGGFDFDIAVIAKYNDPRGGTTGAQKRGNRLPPATADSTKFAYRMPHGALDVSRIVFEGESGGFLADNISASTLRFHVEDYDARATESAQTDLSLDTTVTNVAIGESGAPSLSVCIPGVLGDATVSQDFVNGTDLQDDDSGFSGDASQDSGTPGDPLFYSRSVTKTAGTGQPFGDVTGMVRATDVEATAPLWLVLDGDLAPVTTNAPTPVTYQAFTVNQLPGNLLPTGNWSMTPLSINDGGSTSVSVSNVVDSDSATFNVQVDWGTGGGFVTVATGLTPGAGPFGPYASPVYVLANPMTGEMKTVAVRLVDGVTAANSTATNIGGAVLTVNPAPACTNPITQGTQLFNANFSTTTGNNAWVAGNLFAPPLTNTDAAGYSYWRGASEAFCNAGPAQTALSGAMCTTGADTGATGCSILSPTYLEDYANGLDNNIVSPAFSLVGKTAASLRFDSYFDSGTGSSAVYTVYLSTDNGVTWPTVLYTTTHPGGKLNTSDITAVLPPAALTSATCRLRFRFQDPIANGPFGPGFYYDNTDLNSVGWAIDNVEIFTCP